MRCVWIGWSGAAHTWCEDQFRRFFSCCLDEDHVAVRSIEKVTKNFADRTGTIVSEDTLFVYSTGDLDAREAGDIAEGLIQAGVGSRDDELIIDERDVCAARGALRWRHRSRRSSCDAGC